VARLPSCGGPDLDRASAGEPDEKRGRVHRQRQRPPEQRQVELRILPKTIDKQSVVEFSVTDTGAGLPPESIERVYEAFFSTKVEGMGIGLNLCRSIVESHQGRIKAENIYNADEVTGCRFSFWIPVETGEPHRKPAPLG
jgi:signal transduction histidine kinase